MLLLKLYFFPLIRSIVYRSGLDEFMKFSSHHDFTVQNKFKFVTHTGNERIVELLMDKWADVKKTARDGTTALHAGFFLMSSIY